MSTATAERDEVEEVRADGERLVNLQPPGTREFDIYRRVKIQDAPTRVAAKEFGISQTRVMQIVRRVEEYLRTCGVTSQDKVELNKRLFVIQYQASERIRIVITQMMRALEGTIDGTRVGRRPPGLRGAASSCVDECRYAMTIGRLSLLHTKLPGNAGVHVGAVEEEEREGTGSQDSGVGEQDIERREVEGEEEAEVVIVKCRGGEQEARRILEEMEIDVEEGELRRVAGTDIPNPDSVPSPTPSSPPKEDCSPLVEEPAVQAALRGDPNNASALLDELSELDDLREAMRNVGRAGPVQKEIFRPVEEEAAAAALTPVEEEREMTKRQRNELKRKQEMQKMLLRKLKRPK